jgi:zinc transport system substrate-binding protein
MSQLPPRRPNLLFPSGARTSSSSATAFSRMLVSFTATVAALVCTLASSVAAAHQTASPGAPSITVENVPASGPMRVVVSIPPLKGLVEPMLPAGSTIDVLVPPGVSEHGHEIPPTRLAALAKADLVVTVGLGLEPAVDKFLRDRPSTTRMHAEFAAMVGLAGKESESAKSAGDASESARGKHPDGDEHAGHQHDEQGNCIHTDANDPHLWLDPVLTKQFVNALADQLARRTKPFGSEGPSANSELETARKGLNERLDDLDARYRAAVAAAKIRTIVVGHDAYGRLAARYGFTTVPLAGLHASEPTPGSIQLAIETIRSQKAKVLFAEPQVNQAAAKRVAKVTGVALKFLDPLGNGDYFQVMNDNLESLKVGFAN